MLREIGSAENAKAWIERHLASGERIMGMGHRVYKVRDPRAAVLEAQVEALQRAGVAGEQLTLAREVESVAREVLHARKPDRRLEANVEFYTAVLLDAVGLAGELFTPTFAVARVAGWLAHMAEQKAGGRLMRPLARYVGPMPEAPAAPAA